MQINRGGSNLQSEINITPLVDVVLVLLIIFMVVVPLMLRGYDVDIARTSTDTVASQSEEAQVVLGIEPAGCKLLAPPEGEGLPRDCSVTLADQKVPVAELPKHVAEILGGRPTEYRVLFLDVDDRVNYEGVLRILDLAKAGVPDLKIEFLTTQ